MCDWLAPNMTPINPLTAGKIKMPYGRVGNRCDGPPDPLKRERVGALCPLTLEKPNLVICLQFGSPMENSPKSGELGQITGLAWIGPNWLLHACLNMEHEQGIVLSLFPAVVLVTEETMQGPNMFPFAHPAVFDVPDTAMLEHGTEGLGNQQLRLLDEFGAHLAQVSSIVYGSQSQSGRCMEWAERGGEQRWRMGLRCGQMPSMDMTRVRLALPYLGLLIPRPRAGKLP
ncbi:hypothetical protein B0H19DRAFT_1082977 [Mycena capillaripes]|nr:hypothetical protein B0H19DRAFT_1082977 [Mycena capillaripes]